ncbi:MAG: hypothetical protein ABF491_13690, partial [Acetobacter sp.]|uniref:hypothetical protein n=1 Tax=Acetobacter sp. TaxID=440 RepID=UPI0039E9DA4E
PAPDVPLPCGECRAASMVADRAHIHGGQRKLAKRYRFFYSEFMDTMTGIRIVSPSCLVPDGGACGRRCAGIDGGCAMLSHGLRVSLPCALKHVGDIIMHVPVTREDTVSPEGC